MPPRTMLSRWFALHEFAVSASHPDLVVPVPPILRPTVGKLARHCLDPIRDWLGKPIRVLSGYRSPALNAAVGGSRTSQHVHGEAADLAAPTPAETRRVFEALLARAIDIPAGQVIWYPRQAFLHVALPSPRYATATCCVHDPARELRYARIRDTAHLRSLLQDAKEPAHA